MQILLVEDNESIAKGLKYSFERKKYKVFHSTNVKIAIKFLNL